MGNLVGLVLNYIIFGMNSDGSPRKNKKAADNVASLLIFHCIPGRLALGYCFRWAK